MDIKEWKITKYAGYQEKINLELFQGLLMMIVNLSESKDAMRYLNGLERRVVWRDKKGNDNQFLQGYGYRYPGEVLERYGEPSGACAGIRVCGSFVGGQHVCRPAKGSVPAESQKGSRK